MTILSTALTDRFMSITGPDAIKFLQGQTSCDLNALTDKNFSFSTLNTPKGRMYCLFKVIQVEDGLLLCMNESLLDSTLQRLNKYAAFFKCELKEETSYRAIGFTSLEPNDYEHGLKQVGLDSSSLSALVQDDGNMWINVSLHRRMGQLWTKNIDNLPQVLTNTALIELEHWNALETQIGIPAIYVSSQEEFILQYLNLHHLGAVSFKKGCYTGQEIIARMKFLGKQKKQAYLLHSETQNTPSPLSAVYDSEGKKCGTLIRAHFAKECGTFALAILPIEQAHNYPNVYLNEGLNAAFTVRDIDYSEFKK